MKIVTFKVDTTSDKPIITQAEKIAGGTIKTLHSMTSFKQDDLTTIVTIAVTLTAAAAKKATS